MTVVVVALIALVSTVISVGLSAVLATRSEKQIAQLKATLESEREEQRRRSDAKAVLDRYRGPLLAAAFELGDRIDNIRNRGFLHYAQPGHPRREKARQSTIYRLAQYLGWREILRSQLQLLRFETQEDTRRVADLLTDVTRILARDDYGPHLMLWADEQRGIGELMTLHSAQDATVCLGFAGFLENYAKLARWLDPMADGLSSDEVLQSERCRLLQWALMGLVLALDEEETYGDAEALRRTREEIESTGDTVFAGRFGASFKLHLAAVGLAV